MADRARTMIDRMRAAHLDFERARLVVQSEVKLFQDAGGNNLTTAYLDAHGSGGTLGDELVDMTTAEWQSYWPTLNTASTISAANQLSLSKGLLKKT